MKGINHALFVNIYCMYGLVSLLLCPTYDEEDGTLMVFILHKCVCSCEDEKPCTYINFFTIFT